MIDDLIKSTRSFRRFDETVKVDRKTLEDLVDLARHSASARNRQPLKYALCCDPETNARVFPCTAWAGALKDASTPESTVNRKAGSFGVRVSVENAMLRLPELSTRTLDSSAS